MADWGYVYEAQREAIREGRVSSDYALQTMTTEELISLQSRGDLGLQGDRLIQSELARRGR